MIKEYPIHTEAHPAQNRDSYLKRGFNNFENFCNMIAEFRDSEIEPRDMNEAKEIINDLKNAYCDKAVDATYAKFISGSYGIQTKTEYRPGEGGGKLGGYHTGNFVPNYIEGAAKARNNIVAAVADLKFKY